MKGTLRAIRHLAGIAGLACALVAVRPAFANDFLTPTNKFFAQGMSLGLSDTIGQEGMAAPAVNVRYDYLRSDGFGFNLGGFVEAYRKYFSGNETNLGTEANLTMELLDGYLYGGGNLVLPLVRMPATVTTSYGPWFGWQMGIGFPIGTNIRNIDVAPRVFLLELGLQALTHRASYTSGVSRVLSSLGLRINLLLNFR